VGSRRKPDDRQVHRIPRIRQILFADASATIASSLAGTSTVVSYIESAAGVVAGGRSGVTAIVVGLLFIAALFVAPVNRAVPAAATAPALIVVGSLMMSQIGEIRGRIRRWQSAFLTLVTIPLTFSNRERARVWIHRVCVDADGDREIS